MCDFSSVVYSVKIIPACLHVGNNVSDTEAIATGYGTDADKVKSDQLMKVRTLITCQLFRPNFIPVINSFDR